MASSVYLEGWRWSKCWITLVTSARFHSRKSSLMFSYMRRWSDLNTESHSSQLHLLSLLCHFVWAEKVGESENDALHWSHLNLSSTWLFSCAERVDGCVNTAPQYSRMHVLFSVGVEKDKTWVFSAGTSKPSGISSVPAGPWRISGSGGKRSPCSTGSRAHHGIAIEI